MTQFKMRQVVISHKKELCIFPTLERSNTIRMKDTRVSISTKTKIIKSNLIYFTLRLNIGNTFLLLTNRSTLLTYFAPLLRNITHCQFLEYH